MSRASNKEFYVPKGPKKKSELELFIEKHRLPSFDSMLRALGSAFIVALAVLAVCLVCGFRTVKYSDDSTRYRYCGFMWFGEPTLGRLNSSDGLSATVLFKKIYYSDGSVYTGDVENLQKHGHGTLVFEDGGEYVGTFSEGKFDGHGERKWADGASYSGDFRKGIYHGNGTLRLSDGTLYTGAFKDGEKHGQGEIKYPNGDSFTGEFKNDMRSYGVYTWVNGESLEGTFENNLPSAKEKMIYTDSAGDKYLAIYANGALSQKSVYIPPKDEDTSSTDTDVQEPVG